MTVSPGPIDTSLYSKTREGKRTELYQTTDKRPPVPRIGVAKQNRVVLTPAVIGHDPGGAVEVTSDLTPQDAVILDPPDSLSAGETIEVIESPKHGPAQRLVPSCARSPENPKIGCLIFADSNLRYTATSAPTIPINECCSLIDDIASGPIENVFLWLRPVEVKHPRERSRDLVKRTLTHPLPLQPIVLDKTKDGSLVRKRVVHIITLRVGRNHQQRQSRPVPAAPLSMVR